jgi:putative ATP-binding cassette transporter
VNLIYFLLRTSWVTLTLAVLVGCLSGASSAGLLALINTTLNHAVPKAIVIWSFAGLCLLLVLGSFVSQVLLIRLSQGAVFDLRLLLSRRILSSPLRHLEEIGAHRLLAALTEDIQSVSDALMLIPTFCLNVAIVAGCLIYLSWLSWITSLIMLGFIAFGIFSYQLLAVRGVRFMRLARKQEDDLFSRFQAITEGVKELKLHRQRRQAFLSEDLQPTAAAFRQHNSAGMTTFAVAASWGQLLFFMAIGLPLFTLLTIQDLNAPVISGYVLTLVYLMAPMTAIMSMIPPLGRANVALKQVEALGLSLTSHSTERNTAPAASLPNWERLELIGVTHAYRREREESSFILGPINLTFQAGELIFLVGGNGSGKSTLAKLITGLYVPETGEIRLDGQLVTDENREWYRQHFSAIFSDFYLFERLLGLSRSGLDAQTQDYLIQLQLDHKVQVKDGTLSTTDLSQGQRKRLALLTAYLEDRSIYLFDEWASDQDPLFREIFYSQLLAELKQRGKTVLVISHDERYFHLADRIVKLDYGKLEYEKRMTRFTSTKPDV